MTKLPHTSVITWPVILMGYFSVVATAFQITSWTGTNTFIGVSSSSIRTTQLYQQQPTFGAAASIAVEQKQDQGADVFVDLNHWQILGDGSVEGVVYNHPDIDDGAIIQSSKLLFPSSGTIPISSFHENGEGMMIVETVSGSKYRLRNPRYHRSGTEETSNNKSNVLVVDNTQEGLSLMDDEIYKLRNPGFISSSSKIGSSLISRTTDTGNNENEADANAVDEAKNLMQKVKDAGIAGLISYALWEFGFWTVSVPFCIVAYKQLTGHWPDFQNSDDVQKLGAEAFAFVNVARLAVPLRIGLALGTTPWIQSNIVDRFLTNSNEENGTQ